MNKTPGPEFELWNGMRNFDPLFFSNEKKNYYYYYSYSYSSFSSRVYYILGEKKDSNLEFGIFSPRSRFVYRKEGGRRIWGGKRMDENMNCS